MSSSTRKVTGEGEARHEAPPDERNAATHGVCLRGVENKVWQRRTVGTSKDRGRDAILWEVEHRV